MYSFLNSAWNFGLSFESKLISLLIRAPYLFWLLVSAPCVTEALLVSPHNFHCFQEGLISLIYHLYYFFFFSIDIARSCVCRMVLFAIWTSNWFWAFLFFVIWFFFPSLFTCLFSFVSVPVVSKFLTFEAPQGSWDVLFQPLQTIAYFYHFKNLGLIQSQDVRICFDFFSPLFNAYSSYVCYSSFSHGSCHLLFCG